MPSETVIRALGALIDALANNTAPLWWEMHITLGTAGHACTVTRIANLDHA